MSLHRCVSALPMWLRAASKLDEKLARRCRCQPLLVQIPQQLQPRKFPIAHQKNRHPQHPPENPREVSSLIGRRVTF